MITVCPRMPRTPHTRVSFLPVTTVMLREDETKKGPGQSWHVILCYVILGYVVLCYVILGYVVLCYVILGYVVLGYVIVYYVI